MKEDKEDLEEYRRKKRLVKKMVQDARKIINEEWTLGIVKNFKENNKKN